MVIENNYDETELGKRTKYSKDEPSLSSHDDKRAKSGPPLMVPPITQKLPSASFLMNFNSSAPQQSFPSMTSYPLATGNKTSNVNSNVFLQTINSTKFTASSTTEKGSSNKLPAADFGSVKSVTSVKSPVMFKPPQLSRPNIVTEEYKSWGSRRGPAN